MNNKIKKAETETKQSFKHFVVSLIIFLILIFCFIPIQELITIFQVLIVATLVSFAICLPVYFYMEYKSNKNYMKELKRLYERYNEWKN